VDIPIYLLNHFGEYRVNVIGDNITSFCAYFGQKWTIIVIRKLHNLMDTRANNEVKIIVKTKINRAKGYVLTVLLITTLMLVPACTSVVNPAPPSGATLSSIKVTLASNSSLANALRVFFDMFNPAIKEYTDYPAKLSIGAKAQFIAVGTYSDTAYSAVTSQVIWASSNPAVATISAGGLLIAVADGTTDITATLSGITSPPLVLTVGVPTAATPAALINIGPAQPVRFVYISDNTNQ
jgi:hypothetical protein